MSSNQKLLLGELRKAGLKEKSAAAYLANLKLGSASPHQVAKEADIERTTIYKTLEDLSEQGLISKSVKGKRITYVAEPIESLRATVKKKEEIINKIIPDLQNLGVKKPVDSTIKLYTTRESIRRVMMNSLNSKEKIRRDFASVENVLELFGKTLVQRYIDERVKRKIQLKSLRHRSKRLDLHEKDWYLKRDNEKLLREVRYLDKKIKFEPLIMIYDNTILLVSSQKEMLALAVESKELSRAMKILFDIAWESSK